MSVPGPEAAENDVRSNVGYRRDKRTPCTQNEFCRSLPIGDVGMAMLRSYFYEGFHHLTSAIDEVLHCWTNGAIF
jgi:hypothetical protein